MKLSQYFCQFPESDYNNNTLRNNHLKEMKKGRKGKRQKGISLPIRTSNPIDFPHVIMIYINNNLQGSGRGKRNNDNWREAFEGQSMGFFLKKNAILWFT